MLQVQVLGEEKFKKFLWESFAVYLDVENTKNICCFLCFKIILSNQREVQSDNNRKFTYYMVCISYKKITIKWNRVKFKQTCPRSSTTSRSAKNNTSKNDTSKTEWSSNKHAPEVQLLHIVHFRSRWTHKSWSRHF